MRKRNYSRSQILVIVLLSVGMLAAAVILNRFFPPESREATSTTVYGTTAAVSGTAVTDSAIGQGTAATGSSVTGEPSASAGDVAPDLAARYPTETIATFFQGPLAWKERREWSGKWGKTYYDGSSFGGFGCGLCCMANIYCSFTEYRCSPVDMYEFAKEKSEYGGGGAIDWGYMKETMQAAGFTCDVWKKPKDYADFQKLVKKSLACIVVVSSQDSKCYWENTSGHYVTLFFYDEETDKIFLGDSGSTGHNRQWVELEKVYRSLKTANNWQCLSVTRYERSADSWRHEGISGPCVLPEGWA